MNLFIPAIGTRLRLNKPWQFPLHDEHRNRAFWAEMAPNASAPSKHAWDPPTGGILNLTLPAGTLLSVDRLYIRKGQSGFDSITFRVLKGSAIPTGRFWAKLDDVNKGLDITIIP